MYKLERTALSERESDTLDELQDYYWKDEQALLAAICEDESDLDDRVHAIADGRVSVYAADQLEWLSNNVDRADQENAIACGARSAQQIAAFCWYEAEREEIREGIEGIKDHIEEMDEPAGS